jgi:hypothetical protein
MATISLAELNALLNDAANQPVQNTIPNNHAFIPFVPIDQARNNLGKPPMAVALSDAGYGDSGTHVRGGKYNAVVMPTYSQPKHPDWARYDRSIKYDEQTLDTLSQAGDTAIIQRVNSDVQNAWDTIMAIFNGHLFTNDPEGAGLVDAVSGITHAISASNTYMQTARAANPWFQSYINNVGGPLTSTVADDVIEELEDKRFGRVDAIFTSTTQAKKFAALTGAAQATYDVPVTGNVLTPIIGERSPAGLEGFARKPFCVYQTKPVWAIPGYPSGRADYVALGGEGFAVTYHLMPQWRPFQEVQGESSVIATLKFRAQTSLLNPYKFSGALTGLT